MTIKLEPQEAELYFYNALCNGLGYFQSYGVSLRLNKAKYLKAKKVLEKKQESTCYEDVLMQMLRNGDHLEFVDEECEGEYSRKITLKDVHEKVEQTPSEHLMDMVNENDDATTADVIIQSVLYNDIIFG